MENFINQLHQGPPEKQKIWFPTPEEKPDLSKLNVIESRIYDEILKVKDAESLNPHNSPEEEQKFLDIFVWEESILSSREKKRVEKLLVKYHDVFARHRLDVGKTTSLR